MKRQRPPDPARDALPLDDLPPDAGPALPGAQTPEVFDPSLRDELIEHLRAQLTERRRRRMDEVLARRTRWITVVLEDIFQPHNASAVLRSCECFGVQSVHVAEDRNDYTISRDVALGASRWIDLERWRADEGRTIEACCDDLVRRGYRLVATTPREDAVALEDFDVAAGPVALMFGTELDGLTPPALARASEALHIPMQGFTESLNISVSAALVLRELTARLRASGADWPLTEQERREVQLRWLRRSMKRSDDIIERYIAERTGQAGGGDA